MYRILVAESEPSLLQSISNFFLDQDFTVDQVVDGLKAFELVLQQSYDAVILDRTLPKFGAFEICKQIRGVGSDAAVFIINAEASVEEHEAAVELGADDYLAHPTQVRELSAKVRAVIRRRRTEAVPEKLVCDDVCLDPKSGTVTRTGEIVQMRPMEYVLLEFFLSNQNRVFSAEQLWKLVWKKRGAPSDTVRAHINMLRKKLQSTDGSGSMIKTVKGRGYKLEGATS